MYLNIYSNIFFNFFQKVHFIKLYLIYIFLVLSNFFRFLQLEDDSWINNTTYCPLAVDGECGDVLVTAPKVYWSSPGVLRHDYPQSEAPIVPQIEDWKWMWVSEDNLWAVVVWCGSNPMLEYNGAFVLHRQRSDGTLPTELEPVIR